MRARDAGPLGAGPQLRSSSSLPLVLADRRPTDGRVRFGWLAIGGAIGVAVVSPWLIFNAGRFDQRGHHLDERGPHDGGGELRPDRTASRCSASSRISVSTRAVKPVSARCCDEIGSATSSSGDRRAGVHGGPRSRGCRSWSPRAGVACSRSTSLARRSSSTATTTCKVASRPSSQFWSFYVIAGRGDRRRDSCSGAAAIAMFPLLAFPAIVADRGGDDVRAVAVPRDEPSRHWSLLGGRRSARRRVVEAPNVVVRQTPSSDFGSRQSNLTAE